MSDARETLPFSVYLGDQAGVTFTRIPEVGDIEAPKGDVDEIDVTTHDSDAKEFLLGLADYGECTFPVNFIAGNVTHEALYALAVARTERQFQIKDEDNEDLVLAFPARVKPLAFAFPVVGAVKANVTLRVTGDVELRDLTGSGS
jgi:hypothetical protein